MKLFKQRLFAKILLEFICAYRKFKSMNAKNMLKYRVWKQMPSPFKINLKPASKFFVS